MLGVDSVEVSAKFRKDPTTVPDLSVDTFLARKAILTEVEKWCDSMEGKPDLIPENTWRLINYHYEVTPLPLLMSNLLLSEIIPFFLLDRQILGHQTGTSYGDM